jgi:hypothetical protein
VHPSQPTFCVVVGPTAGAGSAPGRRGKRPCRQRRDRDHLGTDGHAGATGLTGGAGEDIEAAAKVFELGRRPGAGEDEGLRPHEVDGGDVGARAREDRAGVVAGAAGGASTGHGGQPRPVVRCRRGEAFDDVVFLETQQARARRPRPELAQVVEDHVPGEVQLGVEPLRVESHATR